MIDPMPTPDDCLLCAALREENARLRAKLAKEYECGYQDGRDSTLQTPHALAAAKGE